LLAAAIRRADPGALVTTGSASFKWCSTDPAAKGNYWSDQALQAAAGGDALARLDFYQVHYYSWMRGNGWTYSPWDKRRAAWGLDKPVIIGEVAAKGEAGYLDPVQMHVRSVDSGYAGIMSWAYLDNRADKEGAWADAKPGVAAIYAKIPDAIRVPMPVSRRPLRASGIFPGARNIDSRSFALPGLWGRVEVAYPDGVRLPGHVMRGAGETVWSGAGPVPAGHYFIRAEADGGKPADGKGPIHGSIHFNVPGSAPR
jgi:hypothetical protein